MTTAEAEIKQQARDILRYAAILFPTTLAIYGLFDSLQSARFGAPEYVFCAVMMPWLLLGLFLFLFPSRKNSHRMVRFVSYHLFAAAYVLLISGLTPPFVALGWVLLLLLSYIYIGRRGLLLNLSTLVAILFIDITVTQPTAEAALGNLISVGSILIIGAIIVMLTKIQQADTKELVRIKAQESLQNNRMNTLINNLADAIIHINEDGRVEVYNAASLSLLDTNVSLQGQQIDDVLRVHDKNGKEVKIFEAIKKSRGVKVRDDLSMTQADETVRLEITTSPVRSSYSHTSSRNSADGYVLILRDITKAKSLEEERDEFISVVSHELRTPITIAEGTLSNTQLLVAKGKIPPGTLERSLSDAHDQILFLSRMVNDLSTLSRAEHGTADAPEEIDVKKLISELYKKHAPQAEKKQLHFNVDTPGKLGTIKASRLYIDELLQNLITNAIKYTNEGSVTLRATRQGDNILFEVKDTGIGISKSDQAKIFHKFYRSEDYRTRETGGTGLGLYVAAKLAKRLHATIETKSRLNHGSIFSFSLPASDSKDK